MLISITVNDAHSTCVQCMYQVLVLAHYIALFFFSILQINLTQSGTSLIRSVLKGISVYGRVQHLVFKDLTSSLHFHGRCTVT